MQNFIKAKWFTFLTYILLILAVLLIGFVLLNNNRTLNKVITSFFEVAENRSFDYRQYLRVIHRKPIANKDIIVLAIDDASLEMLWDKYGEWPLPRNIYADVIDYIEKDNPQAIIFDLLFIKSMQKELEQDKILTSTMNKYNNIYTGINFDYQTSEVRYPVDLPERLSLNIKNSSNIDISKKYSFPNCRSILTELLEGKVHIGTTNIIRSNDGIIRKVAPLMVYKDKYYPYLAFQGGADYLLGKHSKEFDIDKNSNLIIGEIKIPLNKEGETILNWYGTSGTHTVYPFYKIIDALENKELNTNSNINFKDKIIIVGTTAVSLHDTKSVPIQEGVYPGVEVHATFLNNMLDNNFIKQSSVTVNITILVFVIMMVGAIVMLSTSSILALISTILFSIAYLFITYYVMEIFNLWIPVIMPIISIILAFALSFLTKYLIKSKDFEYQYKLATIDGLTELYNHRYFQETLKNQIEIAKRYGQTFSLIIVDIDHFKKFNDTYGHQAGDAVLKQVAQTIKRSSRTTDIVCRYGGEEMSIILPNTSSEEAMLSAKRINKAIKEKDFYLNTNNTGKVTISVGVASFPENADTAQELIEFADKGLYYAKRHGRNKVIKIDLIDEG